MEAVRQQLHESGGRRHAPAPAALRVVVTGEREQLARIELGLSGGRAARRLQDERQGTRAQERRAARRP